MNLIWVNEDGTVMVQRFESGTTVYVATRPDSGATWRAPIACQADAETAQILRQLEA